MFSGHKRQSRSESPFNLSAKNMPSDPALESAFSEIAAAAKDVSALIVPSTPGGDGFTVHVALGAADLSALIRHVRPQLVYLEKMLFDAAEAIEEIVSEASNISGHPAVEREAKRWKRFNGEVSHVLATVPHQGLNHAAILEASWLEEIDNATRAVGDAVAAASQKDLADYNLAIVREGEKEDRKRRDLIKAKGKIFADDPRFVMPKATRARREHLARTLFSDYTTAMISHIVDVAEGNLWMKNDTKA